MPVPRPARVCTRIRTLRFQRCTCKRRAPPGFFGLFTAFSSYAPWGSSGCEPVPWSCLRDVLRGESRLLIELHRARGRNRRKAATRNKLAPTARRRPTHRHLYLARFHVPMPPPAKYKLKGKRGPDCFWAMSAAALSRHAGGAAASRAGRPTKEIYKLPRVNGKQLYHRRTWRSTRGARRRERVEQQV